PGEARSHDSDVPKDYLIAIYDQGLDLALLEGGDTFTAAGVLPGLDGHAGLFPVLVGGVAEADRGVDDLGAAIADQTHRVFLRSPTQHLGEEDDGGDEPHRDQGRDEERLRSETLPHLAQGDQTQVSHLTASRNRSDSDGAV